MPTEIAAPYGGQTGEPYITALAARKDCCPGWLVQLPLPPEVAKACRAQTLTRSFYDRENSHQALDRARAWRDHWHQTLYGSPVPKRALHTQQRNGSTGVPGVRFMVKKVRSRQGGGSGSGPVHEVPVYIAEVWTIPGRNGERPRGSRSRLWSIAKWGDEEAFRLACEWRRKAADALEAGLPLPT